ncbi:MAG: glycine cleavage system protein GcvH [Anaerolineae bacterium]
MEIPKELKYTEEHEWVKVEGGLCVVGITDYAQDQLGDVVYVELNPVGSTVEQLKPFGVIESVKAASDLYSPLSGEIAEVNEELFDLPELVNQDPYGQGWMIKLRPSDLSEMDKLLTAEGYEAFLKTLEE